MRFNDDVDLIFLQPHMHLRGKDMTVRLKYPDGKANIVLDVPHYEFNWQTSAVIWDHTSWSRCSARATSKALDWIPYGSGD